MPSPPHALRCAVLLALLPLVPSPPGGAARAEGAPTAAFRLDRARGVAPLVVRFEDDSTGVVARRRWDFGDGTGTEVRHPVHTFEAPGVYTVRLTVEGPAAGDVRVRSEVVVVEPRPPCPPPTDTGYSVFQGVPYGGDVDCAGRRCLDVYVPNQPRACAPTLVYYHGGGWSEGSKNDPSTQALAEVLAADGWFVVVVDYPLTTFLPCDGVVGASTYPGVVEDCKTALDWVHTKGRNQYGLSERVVLIGSSAGGHLAALLATTMGPDETLFDPDPAGTYTVDRALLFAPITNLVKIGCVGNPWSEPCVSLCPASPPPDCRFPPGCLNTGGFPAGYPCAGEGANCRHFDAPEALLGEVWTGGAAPAGVDCGDSLARPYPAMPTGNPWYDASPVFWVGGDEPPIHLFHGTCDGLVPSYETTDFAAALSAAGVPTQVQLEAPATGCDAGCRHAAFGLYGVLPLADMVGALLEGIYGR